MPPVQVFLHPHCKHLPRGIYRDSQTRAPLFPRRQDAVTTLVSFTGGSTPAPRQCQLREDNSSRPLDLPCYFTSWPSLSCSVFGWEVTISLEGAVAQNLVSASPWHGSPSRWLQSSCLTGEMCFSPTALSQARVRVVCFWMRGNDPVLL